MTTKAKMPAPIVLPGDVIWQTIWRDNDYSGRVLVGVEQTILEGEDSERKYYRAWGTFDAERLRESPIYRAFDDADPRFDDAPSNKPWSPQNALHVTHDRIAQNATIARAQMEPNEAAPSDMKAKADGFKGELMAYLQNLQFQEEQRIARTRQEAADIATYEAWERGRALVEARRASLSPP